jgi:hypothetical protein
MKQGDLRDMFKKRPPQEGLYINGHACSDPLSLTPISSAMKTPEYKREPL